jgi:hypothetical protein
MPCPEIHALNEKLLVNTLGAGGICIIAEDVRVILGGHRSGNGIPGALQFLADKHIWQGDETVAAVAFDLIGGERIFCIAHFLDARN